MDKGTAVLLLKKTLPWRAATTASNSIDIVDATGEPTGLSMYRDDDLEDADRAIVDFVLSAVNGLA